MNVFTNYICKSQECQIFLTVTSVSIWAGKPLGAVHLFVFFPLETAWVNRVLPFHRLLTFKGVWLKRDLQLQ